MSKTDLTKEDILHIAKLANLSVTDETEIEKYRQQLSETITYVDNLNELDTANIKPSSHSTDLNNVYFEDGTINERGLSAKQATENAQQQKNGMFIVPRIMKG